MASDDQRSNASPSDPQASDPQVSDAQADDANVSADAKNVVESFADDHGVLDAVVPEALAEKVKATSRSGSKPDASSKKKKRKRFRAPRSRAARVTIAFAQVVGVSYVALLVALVCLENRLVYPGAYFSDDNSYPVAGSFGVEKVEYSSEDGTPLKGRLLHREGSSEYLIFFHGNGSKARWLDGQAGALSNAFDATVLLVEYRGYEDDATPSESSVLADCRAGREFLCDKYQCRPEDIILYGRSLGGGCAVAMASRGGAKALVLDRTFDRLVDVAGDKYPFVPVSFLMRNRYDSVAKLTVYDGPLVMLHGDADKLIPVENARRLYDSAGCTPKQWIEVPGLGHNDALASTDLQQIVKAVQQSTQSAGSNEEAAASSQQPVDDDDNVRNL
ncbi:MAG: alpha/beta hydrolase [Rubripirellula sp.]